LTASFGGAVQPVGRGVFLELLVPEYLELVIEEAFRILEGDML